MRVLITPQFNAAMLRLTKTSQQEVGQLFTLTSTLTREQLVDSPLFTKLEGGTGDIYTLRSRSTRVFCTFDENGDVLFLDVREIRYPSIETPTPQEGEVTLFGRNGDPKVYIAKDEDNTIYSFHGRPLAYIDENDNIYGFNGKHLGWFEEGIVWDHRGKRVGFTSDKCPSPTRFEPFKGFKRFKPFKNFKAFAPNKPIKGLAVSSEDLLAFLEAGAK